MYILCRVNDGAFNGKKISYSVGGVYIIVEKINLFDSKRLYLNSSTVESYRLVNQKTYTSERIRGRSRDSIFDPGDRGRRVFNGRVERDVEYENTVLITYKNGQQSLIVIDGTMYSKLEASCKYNIKFTDSTISRGTPILDIDREYKCPHCEQVFYGSFSNCPECRKSMSEPPKFKLFNRKRKRWAVLIYILLVVALWKVPFGLWYWGQFLLFGVLPIGFFIYMIIMIINMLVIRAKNKKK